MNLPTILSGPILRRIDPSQVYIWIATSENYSISANLYQTQKNKGHIEYQQLQVRTNTKTVRLGKQLYIHLVKIMPLQEKFPVHILLGYNLFFTNSLKTYDLSSFQLLSAHNPSSIVYGDFKYPTFFINSKKETTTLYGSCRKLHGKGHDLLAEADEVIGRNFNDLNTRPSSLYMLGDQIYADDVADPIIPYIQKLSQRLIGDVREELAIVEPRLQSNNYTQRLNKIQGRQFIIEQFCKFTSSYAHNHLMTFGEYAVMYLLSWSPSLWQVAEAEQFPKTFEEVYKNNWIHFIFQKRSLTEHQEEYHQHKERYLEQLGDLKYFQQSISKVRRLLANIPTYMMFDDHDITDDWNISLEWKNRVHDAPLGRHIIANGLSAYWAFQGWGNNPDSFDELFIRNMKQYFKGYNIGAPSYKNWIQTLFDFQSWHFTAPTTPKTLFLDTRTLREYDSTPKQVKIMSLIEETVKTPKLIGVKGWELIDKTLKDSGWNKGESLIIASPTPLYGIGVIESFLKNNVYPFRALGIPVHYKLDFEAWKYNAAGFYLFLHQLKEWRPSESIILSGDVHYASTVKADVDISGENLSIYQLTSSPMKNMSFEGLFGSLLKLFVWITTLRRNERHLNRNCDEHVQLSQEIDSSLFQEKISYQSLKHGTIIETNNNLGLFVRTNESVENILLQHSNEEIKQENFEPLPLKKGDD